MYHNLLTSEIKHVLHSIVKEDVLVYLLKKREQAQDFLLSSLQDIQFKDVKYLALCQTIARTDWPFLENYS